MTEEYYCDNNYKETRCGCAKVNKRICHKHELVYCAICDGWLCPKCEQEMINAELEDSNND